VLWALYTGLSYSTDKRFTMINIRFIEELEGNKRVAYVPSAGNSGVTIGVGLDLGSFGNLRVLDLPKELYRLLEKYVGYRREVAEVVLEDSPLVLEEDDVKVINESLLKYKQEMVAKLYNADSKLSWESLTNTQRTVIYSVLHQYGSPRRVPKFWAAATAGDWGSVIEELRDFGDDFPTRRNKEADYLEKELGYAS